MSIVSSGTKGGSVLVTIAVGGGPSPLLPRRSHGSGILAAELRPAFSLIAAANVSRVSECDDVRSRLAFRVNFAPDGFIESFNARDQSLCLFTRRYACVVTVRATSHGSEANGTLLIHLRFRRRAGSLVPVLV